jgi:RNA-directed DNA polymerase
LDKTKPFDISKKVVYEAYLRVKANQGAAGVDEQSVEDFETDLKRNLYKIWNRMSSGTYFPPPVRSVEGVWQRFERNPAICRLTS